MMRPLLHPAHRSVPAGLEPLPKFEPGGLGRIGTRKAASDETEPLQLRSLIASSRLWPLSTGAPLHRPRWYP